MTAEGLTAIAFAPFLGSFLGVVIDRLPTNRPIMIARSACDHCGHRLSPRELVPLLSYLLQGGRCLVCGEKLRPFYPMIELATVLMVMSAYLVLEGWLLWFSIALGACLLILSAIDLRHFILPDGITLPLIPIGLTVAYILEPGAIEAHLIGAAMGFIAFAGIALLYRRLRDRDGLGLGDAKLLAGAGAWLGWQALPGLVLLAAGSALLAAVAGMALGERLEATSAVAFGPFLALAFWTTWLFGPVTLA